MTDKARVMCDAQEHTDWLATYLAETGLMPTAQVTALQMFEMGTEFGRCGRMSAKAWCTA